MSSPAGQQPTQFAFLEHKAGWLWVLAVLDMMAVALMISFGETLDRTGGLADAVTLGGHHQLVFIMAAVGFVMLLALAAVTGWFSDASSLQWALITIACAISIAAVAGALLGLLLTLVVAWLLGSAGRLLLRL